MLDFNEVVKAIEDSLENSNYDNVQSEELSDSAKEFIDSLKLGITYFPHPISDKE